MPLSPRSFLQYAHIFELLPLNIRNAIYAKSETRSYKAGEYVFRIGDEAPYFMAGVMSGRLRMGVRSKEGKEILLTMVEKGELFGEMSVLDELPRAVDVSADMNTTVIVMPREDVLPHLRNNPDAMLGMFKITCHRMRLYIRTLELLALQNVEQKLGRLLLHLARDYGTKADGQTVIDAHLTQSDLGLQLGVSRESINKQLNGFIDRNLLRYDGEHIILTDIDGLKKTITGDY